MAKVPEYTKTFPRSGSGLLGHSADGDVHRFPIDGFARRRQLVGHRGLIPLNIDGGTPDNYTRFESQIRTNIGRKAVREIQIAYCNFYITSAGDTLGPNDYTLSAAFLQPQSDGQNYGPAIPFTFGASKNPVIGAGSGFIYSNPVGLELDPGAMLIIRSGAVLSSAGHRMPGGLKLMTTDDKMSSSSAVVSQVYTNSSWATPAGGQNSIYGHGPVMIIGIPEEPMISVAIRGDSIGYGQGDSNDNNGNSGYICRGLWSVDGYPVPYTNLSRSGDKLSSNTPRASLLRSGVYPFVSDVIVELGINDLSTTDTLSTIQGNMQSVWRGARRAGCRVHQCLITPKTTSDNSAIWTSDADATAFEPGQKRDQLNAWIQTRVGLDIDGVINPNAVLEDPTNHGFWKQANYTSDGLHIASTGAIAAAAVVNAYVSALNFGA